MSTTIEYERPGKLPILTKANARQWFNQAQTTLEAKDIEHVLTTTKDLYAYTNGLSDSDKAKAFKKDDANARLIILKGLDQFAQTDVEEMRTCKAIWEHLQVKYKDKRPATGLAILRDLTNYTFASDQKISEAWNNIKNKRRHLNEINPDVAKAFSENQCFQILLNSLPEAYTSLADSLMTSEATTDEKLQKLMDKEDTLTNSGDAAMAAYRKSFKVSCFLCGDAYLVAQCPHLSIAQAHVKKELVKSRSRSKHKKSRRHYHRHNSSGSESSQESSSEESSSEDDKKKKPKKKPSKSCIKKKTRHAHTATSGSDSKECTHQAYGAQSQSDSGSDVDDEEVHAYIAAAKEQGSLNELLKLARTQPGRVGSGLWQDYYDQRRTQSGGVIAEQGEQVD